MQHVFTSLAEYSVRYIYIELFRIGSWLNSVRIFDCWFEHLELPFTHTHSRSHKCMCVCVKDSGSVCACMQTRLQTCYQHSCHFLERMKWVFCLFVRDPKNRMCGWTFSYCLVSLGDMHVVCMVCVCTVHTYQHQNVYSLHCLSIVCDGTCQMQKYSFSRNRTQ